MSLRRECQKTNSSESCSWLWCGHGRCVRRIAAHVLIVCTKERGLEAPTRFLSTPILMPTRRRTADAPGYNAAITPNSAICARKFAATRRCRTIFACLQLFSIRHLYNAQDLRPKDANRLVRGVCVKSWVEWLLLGRRVDQFQPDMKTCLVKPVGLGVSSWR